MYPAYMSWPTHLFLQAGMTLLRMLSGRSPEHGKSPCSHAMFNSLISCRSVSFGPVFALVFVMLLRTKLLREKRRVFVIFLFVVSVLSILVLMLFTRDGWWNVLDLLSICVSWCAVASYIIVDELRGITAAVTDYEGRIVPSQRSRSRGENADDDDSGLETARASLQSDGMFTIGDDSTLGDQATHSDS